MQKTFLLLCFTAWLTTFASAQTSHIEASWTAEKTVVFKALPETAKTVALDLPSSLRQVSFEEVQAVCTKMSNDISGWQLSDDGKSFIISLHRDAYPTWMQKDWELYINRVLKVYVPN